MAKEIYWADLQGELAAAGLSVSLALPNPQFAPTWGGQLDEKPFVMSISAKSEEDGFRDWMVLSLYGQDAEKVIPLFSKFMGYEPIACYKFKSNPQCTATYEWRRIDQEKNLDEIREDSNITDLVILQAGFKPPIPKRPEEYYQQFTDKIVSAWEESLKENPDADLNGQNFSRLLPFVKKAMPRIAKKQSLFGLSIICLDRKLANESRVVSYGLIPLLDSGIITPDDAKEIETWYASNKPVWDSEPTVGRFEKHFEIDGQRYRLYTDSCRNCRDLNIQAL